MCYWRSRVRTYVLFSQIVLADASEIRIWVDRVLSLVAILSRIAVCCKCCLRSARLRASSDLSAYLRRIDCYFLTRSAGTSSWSINLVCCGFEWGAHCDDHDGTRRILPSTHTHTHIYDVQSRRVCVCVCVDTQRDHTDRKPWPISARLCKCTKHRMLHRRTVIYRVMFRGMTRISRFLQSRRAGYCVCVADDLLCLRSLRWTQQTHTSTHMHHMQKMYKQVANICTYCAMLYGIVTICETYAIIH